MDSLGVICLTSTQCHSFQVKSFTSKSNGHTDLANLVIVILLNEKELRYTGKERGVGCRSMLSRCVELFSTYVSPDLSHTCC